ncbi:uncharacterized protein LOC126372951 [Pectinophora gossypiella]|uniref:uncharacterized protein LOC126372951 n=1 Tax=Pectinophora gossypiella TaxID=13191 RepID=UPI00214EA484|nr:uncharacterized protein LOC126372951 [Pectinophora gossypiella]
MGEQVEDKSGEVNMSNREMVFDNLTILKELDNIANLVKCEDFLETVPKAKLRRVKWVPMFNCLKQGIFDEMVQELSSMWTYENMALKQQILEKQKEKFETNAGKIQWRPQLGDVKAQLKASDVANLRKQKVLLESLAKEYESRVNRLKNTLSAKRGYLKVLQMDIQKYQKKNEDFVSQINGKLENHEHLVSTIVPPRIDVEEIKWNETDLEIDE